MSKQLPNVRLQNLRDFTAQIRHPVTDMILGTGILVSTDKILTCAHVVVAAGVHLHKSKYIPRVWKIFINKVLKPKSHPMFDSNNAEVGVYFPQANVLEARSRRAKVAACFPEHDDDVVVLQLIDGPAPLGPEQIAVLGTADEAQGNAFRSYGYRRLDEYVAGWADGRIQGAVEPPEDRRLQAEPVQLESNQINRGMSGAGILSIERNLVVGIVSETWYPDKGVKDQNTAWAVNARVLGLDPFNLPVQRESPRPKTLQPIVSIDELQEPVATEIRTVWHNAPSPLSEWVGREDLLGAIDADWTDPNCYVTGLIGFGGEGKTSLARQWVEQLLRNKSQKTDGVFWWGFCERGNVDEFFEAAAKYLTGARTDLKLTSSTARMNFISGMLHATNRSYLFILDGLEVLQYQDRDKYGLLTSGDLLAFLTHFVTPGHQSFCLITSRVPLIDLLEYATFRQHDVKGLSRVEGRLLLRKTGVKGPDEALDKLVVGWEGHALTLGLVGTYFADRYRGDLNQINQTSISMAPEIRENLISRILRSYEEHLTKPEIAFLMIFGAFRRPVHEVAFNTLFRVDMGDDAINTPLSMLDYSSITDLVKRLVRYRCIRQAAQPSEYTMHPLVRAHFFARFTTNDPDKVKDVHRYIATYYYQTILGGTTPDDLKLKDITDLFWLFEVVHHLCAAGLFDWAHTIRQRYIYQFEVRLLTHRLGFFDAALSLMEEFFPDGDTSKDPQVSDREHRRWILNEVGLCLMSTGRLIDAAPFYKRALAIVKELNDVFNASLISSNIAELHYHLGELVNARDVAQEALVFAEQSKEASAVISSLALLGWTSHLSGKTKLAGSFFKKAEELQSKIDRVYQPFWGAYRPIYHAIHLKRVGDIEYARKVTEAHLEMCLREQVADPISRCHRILAELDAKRGDHDGAREHYEEAIKIARSISRRDVLIETLISRGQWYARQLKNVAMALADLNEALGHATSSGYRLYEVDIRIGLSWTHHLLANDLLADAEANRARQISKKIGYHWGKIDANAIFKALKQGREKPGK